MTKITLLKVLSQVAGMVTTVLLIAALSKESYGLYVAISSVLLISLNTYNNGASLVEARRVSKQDQTEGAAPKQVIPKTALISVPVSIVELAVLFIFFPEFIQSSVAIAVIVLYFVSENLKYTLSGHFRGAGKVEIGSALVTVPNVIFALLALASFWFLTEIYQVFLLRTLASVFTVGYAFIRYRGKATPLKRATFPELMIELWESLKIGLSAAANQVYKNTGILLVASLLGYASVATYKVSILIAFPMTIPAFLMSAVLVKPIGKAITTGNQAGYAARCRQVQILNLAIAVPNVLVVLVFNSAVPYITSDPKFHIDTWVSLAEVVTLFIQNAFGPTNLLLHLQGRSWLVLSVTILGAALNLAVSFVLISQVGLIGAVIGTAISMTFIQTFGRVVNNRIGEVKNGSIERIFSA